jgi:magnesium-transporting ATPase (P-type)
MGGRNGPSAGRAEPVPAVVAWHATPADEVLARLESRPDGLTIVEAQRRLTEHGPNALTRQRGPSAWQVLLRQCTSPLIYALLASAAVAFALGDVPDGTVVLAVVVLNALIGFVQEYRAGKAIQALAQLVSEPARVRRDGRWAQAGADALVPGDVVSLEAGARVVADLRILQARGPGSTSPTCSTATRPARCCPSTPPASTWRARRPTGRPVRRT